MKIIDTDIADVKLIEPAVFTDDRGYFLETGTRRLSRAMGWTGSSFRTTSRVPAKMCCAGCTIRFRIPRQSWCAVSAGAVFDVAVDLRRRIFNLPPLGGVELSAENHRMLVDSPASRTAFWRCGTIPDLAYKCTDVYASQHERTLVWNDPDIAIDWPLLPGRSRLFPRRTRSASR